jgi:uncharacterized protein YbjT (DUF2867 family)
MTAIIAGATGLVGSECLRLLSTRYNQIIALVRRRAGIPDERVVDFDQLGALEFPAGAHVYCALGTTIKKAGSQPAFRRVDFDYPLALAERAAAARGRFMLVSSVGADPKSNNFYLRVKGELEDRIRVLPLDACHIFHPSFLIGDRAEKRTGEKAGIAIARTINLLLIGGLRKYRAIEATAVARAMVAAAQKNSAGTFVYHYDEIKELAG